MERLYGPIIRTSEVLLTGVLDHFDKSNVNQQDLQECNMLLRGVGFSCI